MFMAGAMLVGLTPRSIKRGDGAGGVVGVQGGENEVAGQGGVDGGFGRFQIADFAHHYNVGSCLKDGPKPAEKE